MEENIIMDENLIGEESEIENEESIADEDNTEKLLEEDVRRRREGRADDIVSMQAAVCLLIAAGLVILNLAKPDIAEELVGFLRELASVDKNIIPNPVDSLIELIKNHA